MAYNAIGDPGSRDFDEAAGLTCDHIVDTIRNFLMGSTFIFLESAFCDAVATANTPILIEFEVGVVFAKASTAVPSQSDVDELINIALSEPAVEALIADLQGLPSSNPLSSTTGVTYQVLRRLLVEGLLPARFSSAFYFTWTHGITAPFLLVALFWG